MAQMIRRRTKPPTMMPAMKKPCQRWNSVRPCVVAPLYSPKVGSVQPVRRNAATRTPARASRRRGRGGEFWGVESVEMAEGLVNDESTALTLSHPAEKDEVAVQRL